MTVKVTLTATRLFTIDPQDQSETPDEIGDTLADQVQENPAKFISDVRTKIEITADVELSPEP